MTFETIQKLEKQRMESCRRDSKYHRLYQKANGKLLRCERTRDRLLRDKLFLKRKIWAILAVLPDDANWHNAPDYIRHFKSQMSAHAKQANHYQKLYESLKKNSMSIVRVQEMAIELANDAALTGYDGATYNAQEIAAFIKEWRQNNES